MQFICTRRPEESNLTGGATVPRKVALVDELEPVEARPHSRASRSRCSTFRENACPSGPTWFLGNPTRDPSICDRNARLLHRQGRDHGRVPQRPGQKRCVVLSTPQIRFLVSNRVPIGIVSNSSNQGFPMGSDSIDAKKDRSQLENTDVVRRRPSDRSQKLTFPTAHTRRIVTRRQGRTRRWRDARCGSLVWCWRCN